MEHLFVGLAEEHKTMSILVWYLVISYVVVMGMLFVEAFIDSGSSAEFKFLLLILLFAPLTVWYGLLYYIALFWCKYRKQPFKPWI